MQWSEYVDDDDDVEVDDSTRLTSDTMKITEMSKKPWNVCRECKFAPKWNTYLISPIFSSFHGQLTLRKGCTLYRHITRDLEQNCRGVNHKHPSAERWDLEFGFQTPRKNFKTHWKIWKLTRLRLVSFQIFQWVFKYFSEFSNFSVVFRLKQT